MTATTILNGETYRIVDLPAIFGEKLMRMPMVRRILAENLLRHGEAPALEAGQEICFRPGRLLMHDTTFGPALADIAAARAALAEAGGNPANLNPSLPIDVSTDHSIVVDEFGRPGAAAHNMAREMSRNRERFGFMKWAAHALENLTVHPPGSGIMHTINLERLASVAEARMQDGAQWAVPDTLIGTDSHTPMINGLGVLAWGVGGLEAESAMFGMPLVLAVPRVLGIRLNGRLRDGVLATDLALTLCAMLRRRTLANTFVEFFGPGVSALSAGERSTVANMAPEYGCAACYFPIDARTIAYLAETGRDEAHCAFVEGYARRTGLWFDPGASPTYDEVIELDLGAVAMSLAGPRRPQDRVAPGDVAAALKQADRTAGSMPAHPVALAAITSCTNTSDPRLVIAAGLLARKARARSLTVAPWVKTSLAPGSPTAARYLERAGLMADLAALGFDIVGYGCTTCIGNSGPLTLAMTAAMADGGNVPVAVLSGNRNFPGRVHNKVSLALLASPPLVVAYALAGDADRDIATDPIGHDEQGRPIRLADIWPTGTEIDAAVAQARDAADYDEAYRRAAKNAEWIALDAPKGTLFPFDPASSYIKRPPFVETDGISGLGHFDADPLLVLGDDVTTDHISPAGAIPADSAAGLSLIAQGTKAADLNSYAARRANWEIMLQGLFTNPNVRNLLAPGLRPGETLHVPTGAVMPLWQAAARYRADNRAVVIVAGERYGMGSSRDWASKGVHLLGVRAVLARSFEGIHRANLINMGILPLLLPGHLDAGTMALCPGDRFEITAPVHAIGPHAMIEVTLHRAGGGREHFTAQAAIGTAFDVEVLVAGGMIPLILQRQLASLRSAKPERF